MSTSSNSSSSSSSSSRENAGKNSSNDAVRKRILDKRSENEKATSHWYALLEQERSLKMLLAEMKYNCQSRSLRILTEICDIPITPPAHFPWKMNQLMSGPFDVETNMAINTGNNTFGIFFGERIDLFTYRGPPGNIEQVGSRHDIVYQPHYFGKLVQIAPEGGSADETEDLITLKPRTNGVEGVKEEYQEDEEEEYTRLIYRNRRGVVKSYLKRISDEDNELYSVVHFGTVPWKVRERREGSFTNVIFTNVNTGEVRRYIIKGKYFQYFMLQDEIFASFDVSRRNSNHIIRCSTGEVILECPGFTFFIDCATYAVRLTRGLVDDMCYANILYLTPDEMAVDEKPVE